MGYDSGVKIGALNENGICSNYNGNNYCGNSNL